MIHHFKRATRILIFWSLIALAVLLSVIRLVFYQADVYKAELESVMSAMAGAPCAIGAMRVNIYGLSPKLILHDIDILTPDRLTPAIELQEIQLRLDLWNLLSQWDFAAATRISLIGVKLSVIKKTDGRIRIVGLQASDRQPEWLLASGQYEMLDSEVIWRDEANLDKARHFKDVAIYVNNQLEKGRHQINIDLHLPEALGDSLQFVLLFSGDLFQFERVNGRLYVQGRHIRFGKMWPMQGWGDYRVQSGSGDFSLWADWQDSRMVSLSGRVSIDGAEIRAAGNKHLLAEHVAGVFQLRQQNDGWRLAVKELALQLNGVSWQENDFNLWIAAADWTKKNWPVFSVNCKRLDIGRLTELALRSGILPESVLENLRRWQPAGTFRDLFLYVNPEQAGFAINSHFENFGFTGSESYPHIKRLSGSVYGDARHGYVQLASRNMQFEFPAWFGRPLNFARLQGRLHWRQQSRQWLLSSSRLQVQTGDFDLYYRGLLKIPKQSQARVFVDVQTAFDQVKDIRSLVDYMPTAAIGRQNVDWIRSLVLSGQVLSGKGIFYGYPEDYPFYNGRGVCELMLDVRNVSLAYDPQWPYVTGIDAQVLLLGDRLQVDIERGRINGARIKNTVALVPSLFQSDYLSVQGEVWATLGQTVGFFQQTPLAAQFAPVLQTIALQGDSRIDLDMRLALKEGLGDKINGVAHLSHTEIRLLDVDLLISDVQGELGFTEQAIFARQLRGQVLQRPVWLRLDRTQAAYVVRANGTMAVDTLPLGDFWRTRIAGDVDYRLALTVPDAEEENTFLQFYSDLTGLTLDVPEPLAKRAEQRIPLSIHLDFDDSRNLPVTISYADVLKAAIQIQRLGGAVFSADLVIGKGSPEFLHHAGVRMRIKRDRFDLSPWMDLLAALSETASSAPPADELVLDTQHCIWQGRDYGPVSLQLERRQQQWQGNFETRFAAGGVVVPDASENAKISLDMHYLNLDKLSVLTSANADISPLDFPLIKINSRQLIWKNINLGALAIDTERIEDGLVFKRFVIKQQNRRLSSLGSSWKINGDKSFTEVVGLLEMDDFGVFLSELKVTEAMRATPVKIDFSASWEGAPFQFSWSDVRGQMDVRMGEGRLLGIEPGIGRLLGILDLGQMGRRLQLDFSDVYAEGLSYERIRGSFILEDGLAKTDDLMIDSMPAIIKITGNTDLQNQNFDQVITVIPKSSAVLPIAGTIMQGFTSLMTKTFTGSKKDGLFFGAQYTVKGKWGAAKIVPLHKNDGLIRKAWLGITDFSWLGIEKEAVESE